MINAKSIGLARARDVHQTIIVETLFNLRPEVKLHRGWSILPEALVTENPYDNYPDIIVKDETKTPVFCMEITRKWSLKYDIRKCEKLQERFPDCAFFVYNYETDILYGLTPDGLWLNSNENSLVCPLFLHPIMDYIFVPEIF